jgi:hypothetical protein
MTLALTEFFTAISKVFRVLSGAAAEIERSLETAIRIKDKVAAQTEADKLRLLQRELLQTLVRKRSLSEFAKTTDWKDDLQRHKFAAQIQSITDSLDPLVVVLIYQDHIPSSQRLEFIDYMDNAMLSLRKISRAVMAEPPEIDLDDLVLVTSELDKLVMVGREGLEKADRYLSSRSSTDGSGKTAGSPPE